MPMSPHRPALAALLVAAVAVLAFMATTPAFAADPLPAPVAPAVLPPLDPSMDRLPATAMRYLGTSQGECWTFVQRVIKEATGRTMGFEYRQGFFDAGATEVTAKDARSGDIIQIARDSNTAADADYPGLHTAIVIAPALNDSGRFEGKFKVIDANSRFDGIVRVRENYDPMESVGRYPGLNYHIYRLGGAPSIAPPLPKAALLPPPPSSGPLSVGDRAMVKTDDGSCLNLRDDAGTQSNIVVCLPDGTPVTVLGGANSAGGRIWLKVRTPGHGDGWVAAEYVTLPATAQESSAGGGVKQLKTFKVFIPLTSSDD